MPRLIVVSMIASALAAAVFLHWNAAALTLGLLAGAAFFLLAMAHGGGLAEARLPQWGKPGGPGARPPADPNAGIGTALAAAGIASSAVVNPHYPPGFRVFYGVCIAAGLLIALFLAWRGRNLSETAPPRL